MLRINQNIVSEVEFFEQRYAPKEIRLQEEAVIGLALNDVANADELWIFRERFELGAQIRLAQINPADYTQDKSCTLCQFEQPMSFVERLPRLNGDAPMKIVPS